MLLSERTLYARPTTGGSQAATWAIISFLIICTFLIRWPYIGHPDIFIDEEFYLVSGQAMLHGALPYVDFWDRKPIGLFLLYAGMASLPGNAIWTYQIISALFVSATAIMIWQIARRNMENIPAVAAGLSYVAMLPLLNGSGGQSPVYYNLLTISAIFFIMTSKDSAQDKKALKNGLLAMFAFGIAIQIKYTVIFEGIFCGISSLYYQYKMGVKLNNIIKYALLYVIIAVLPTACALYYYYLIGHADSFFYANFLSIFRRESAPSWYVYKNLVTTCLLVAPVALGATYGLYSLIKDSSERTRADGRFLVGWVVAALLGFLSIGNFFDHYALPLLLALCVASGRTFRKPLLGVTFGLCILIWTHQISGWPLSYKQKSRQMIDEASTKIKPYTRHGCMFIYDAPIILYYTTGACMPWRYPFPFHLSDYTERNAVDADTHIEMRKIIDAQPAVVLTASKPFTPQIDWTNQNMLYKTLQQKYIGHSTFSDLQRTYTIHVRKDLVN